MLLTKRTEQVCELYHHKEEREHDELEEQLQQIEKIFVTMERDREY